LENKSIEKIYLNCKHLTKLNKVNEKTSKGLNKLKESLMKTQTLKEIDFSSIIIF
jgi:hypothetical protein